MLVLILLLGLCTGNVLSAGHNLLNPGLTAIQGATTHEAPAQRAIDGNTGNGQWGSGSCTHTPGGSNWWKVILAETSVIYRVNIYNRLDCCQDRIDGAEVYVGNKFCGKVQYRNGQALYPIDCPANTIGGFIEIKQPRNILTLCEVQAMGEPQTVAPVTGRNLLNPYLETSQSQTTHNGFSQRAIDGNTGSGQWNSQSCTHTVGGNGNWWKVKLAQPSTVQQVRIYNRLDCCQDRINHAQVFVGNTLCGTVYYNHNQGVYTINCPPNTVGDYIKIKNNNILTLCEVEAIGEPVLVKCTGEDGKEYEQGESYENEDELTCTCMGSGDMHCSCGETLDCSSGEVSWTNEETCESKCIAGPGYCSSSGDPHYRTFDGKYFDFHGMCTYQAASCDDFKVNFKNIDFYNRAPRYTKRAELVFKGRTFAIEKGYTATVDGVSVNLPYVKTYKNGDTVSILNNGQLEIILDQKSRSPAVRIRGSNAGSYINAEMWLHGSCAGETEGLCGNFNGDSRDDITGGSENAHGEQYEHYDENCPAPPDPYHPCDDVPNGHNVAAAICNDLNGEPFSQCNEDIPIGNEEGGVYHNCMVDVCNCFGDQSCACSQYDNYASTCIDAGIDLSDWRKGISYCPYECPEGLSYYPAADTPAPTCLDRNPVKTGTARGCFCPSDQFLQDGVCVDASDCKCLYEGKFYEVGDKVAEEGTCQTCVCGDSGVMTCSEMTCPELSCAGDEIESSDDEKCCSFCTSDWVRAVEPSNVTVAYGQSASFSVEVLVKKVKKSDKVWTKDGEEITKERKNKRRTLNLKSLKENDSGTYQFTATKGESSKTVEFTLNVLVPKEAKFEVKIKGESEIECNPKDPKGTCRMYFTLEQLGDEEADPKKAQVCDWVDGEAVKCGKAVFTQYGYYQKVKTKEGVYVFVYTDGGRQYISPAVNLYIA